jgi:very-short-patch-repair endonuclease
MQSQAVGFLLHEDAALSLPFTGRVARVARRVGFATFEAGTIANERARTLRKTMTPQEVKLWVQLRQLRPQGLHFRRQAPLEGYILDFVCFQRRLSVEVDGSQHGEEAGLVHDAKRDAHFAALGFLTLRFWNSDIDRNLDGIVETIFSHAQNQGVRHG